MDEEKNSRGFNARNVLIGNKYLLKNLKFLFVFIFVLKWFSFALQTKREWGRFSIDFDHKRFDRFRWVKISFEEFVERWNLIQKNYSEELLSCPTWRLLKSFREIRRETECRCGIIRRKSIFFFFRFSSNFPRFLSKILSWH